MIEILQAFITLIVNTFNQIFFIEIELSETMKMPLGVILIAICLFVLIIVIILDIYNIKFGGGDGE